MNIKKTLKRNKLTSIAFAKYSGYEVSSIRVAIKKGDVRACLEHSLIFFLCEKKGIDLKELVRDMIVE